MSHDEPNAPQLGGIFMHSRIDHDPPLFARAGWIFNLSRHPKARAELEACARSMSSDEHGFLRESLSAQGHVVFTLAGQVSSYAPHRLPEALRALRSIAVYFAALSAWQCGPHLAVGSYCAQACWNQESIEAQLTHYELDLITQDTGASGFASNSRAKARL